MLHTKARHISNLMIALKYIDFIQKVYTFFNVGKYKICQNSYSTIYKVLTLLGKD